MKLDRLNPRTLISEDGVPTQFFISLQQRMAEKTEGVQSAIGDQTPLSGGASLADVIAFINAMIADVQAVP